MTQTVVSSYDELWHAVQAAAPGDQFLLAPGDYANFEFAENHFDPAIRISSQNPAQRARVNLVTLDGPSGFHFFDFDVQLGGAWDYGLKVWSCEDIVLSGLRVIGPPDSREGQGANISDSENVLLSGCEFRGMGSGILGNGSTGVTLSGNRLHDLRTDGIFLGGCKKLTITGNKLSDMFPQPGDHCDAIQLSADTRTWAHGDGIMIIDNDIRRGAGALLQGVFIEDNDNVTITGNAMCGTMTNGISLMRTVGGRIDNNFVQGFEDCWSKIYAQGTTDVTATNNFANHIESGTANVNIDGGGNVTIPLAQVGDYDAMMAWRAIH